MKNAYIIAVVILVVFLAVRTVVKRNKKSCCSGNDYVAKRKKLKKVFMVKIFRVEGMHCQNCVNRVMEDVQSIPYVSAQVDLKKGLVKLSLQAPVADEVLTEALETGGFKVVRKEQEVTYGN